MSLGRDDPGVVCHEEFETLAPPPGIIVAWRGGVSSSFPAGGTLGVAKHVQCDPAADGRLSPDPVHRLLHLAMATVAPFHGVGGRTSSLSSRNVSAFSKLGDRSFWKICRNPLKRRTRCRSRASFASAVSVRHRRSNRR